MVVEKIKEVLSEYLINGYSKETVADDVSKLLGARNFKVYSRGTHNYSAILAKLYSEESSDDLNFCVETLGALKMYLDKKKFNHTHDEFMSQIESLKNLNTSSKNVQLSIRNLQGSDSLEFKVPKLVKKQSKETDPYGYTLDFVKDCYVGKESKVIPGTFPVLSLLDEVMLKESIKDKGNNILYTTMTAIMSLRASENSKQGYVIVNKGKKGTPVYAKEVLPAKPRLNHSVFRWYDRKSKLDIYAIMN